MATKYLKKIRGSLLSNFIVYSKLPPVDSKLSDVCP